MDFKNPNYKKKNKTKNKTKNQNKTKQKTKNKNQKTKQKQRQQYGKRKFYAKVFLFNFKSILEPSHLAFVSFDQKKFLIKIS